MESDRERAAGRRRRSLSRFLSLFLPLGWAGASCSDGNLMRAKISSASSSIFFFLAASAAALARTLFSSASTFLDLPALLSASRRTSSATFRRRAESSSTVCHPEPATGGGFVERFRATFSSAWRNGSPEAGFEAARGPADVDELAGGAAPDAGPGATAELRLLSGGPATSSSMSSSSSPRAPSSASLLASTSSGLSDESKYLCCLSEKTSRLSRTSPPNFRRTRSDKPDVNLRFTMTSYKSVAVERPSDTILQAFPSHFTRASGLRREAALISTMTWSSAAFSST
mmetsp:Transcript_25291/g.58731  ORF Transcript_25291/g.58731 Transcript_25291/m.58731 type:complete len:286 (+) Transcript_25291:291-1148(+)